MSQKEEHNIQNIEDEVNDYYTDDDLYNINSWGADLSFRELITMYEEGELLKPEIQRYYVWDKVEASRFIDSLLLGLPVPSIFLARTKNEKKLIIDGYQRIMTVYDYTKGVFTKDKSVFKLSNSDRINDRWKNKAFSELTDSEQRRIKSTTIHAIIFEQVHPRNNDTSLFQIFERINTSGRPLMTQEIRNCVYQGEFNTLLLALNKNPTWRILYGLENIDSRMRDVEFILRFFALSSDEIKKANLGGKGTAQISLKKFLNTYMDKNNGLSQDVLNNMGNNFITTMEFIYKNLGSTAFNNFSTQGPIKRFHPTIFDAVSIASAYALRKYPDITCSNLLDKKQTLLKSEIFDSYISIRTTNIAHINGRISLALNYLFGMEYE